MRRLSEIASDPTRSDEKPPNEVVGSEPPSEALASNSVYDFLYHDARRIGSFLSQFEAHGLPSSVKATSGAGRGTNTKTAFSGSGKIPVIIQGSVGHETTTSDEIKDSIERTFDPLWMNARSLLDYLQSQDLIQRDIWAARIGQFALVQGTMIFLDMGLLRNSWDKPSVKKKFIDGFAEPNPAANRNERRRNRQRSNEDPEGQFVYDVISSFPHPIQSYIVGENFTVWITLAEASLAYTSSDLVLKHGALVPGVWSMLGIVDAFPDVQHEPTEENPSVDDVVAGLVSPSVGNLAATMAPVARSMIGRPRTAFGMTPLMIFREVSGRLPPQDQAIAEALPSDT